MRIYKASISLCLVVFFLGVLFSGQVYCQSGLLNEGILDLTPTEALKRAKAAYQSKDYNMTDVLLQYFVFFSEKFSDKSWTDTVTKEWRSVTNKKSFEYSLMMETVITIYALKRYSLPPEIIDMAKSRYPILYKWWQWRIANPGKGFKATPYIFDETYEETEASLYDTSLLLLDESISLQYNWIDRLLDRYEKEFNSFTADPNVSDLIALIETAMTLNVTFLDTKLAANARKMIDSASMTRYIGILDNADKIRVIANELERDHPVNKFLNEVFHFYTGGELLDSSHKTASFKRFMIECNNGSSSFDALKDIFVTGCEELYFKTIDVKSLDFSRHYIDDLRAFNEFSFPSLERVNLSNSTLVDHTKILLFKNASTLILENANLKDISFLSDFRGIKSLDLSNNPNLANMAPTQVFKSMTGLLILNLDNTGLSKIPKLPEGIVTLLLNDNKIKDIGKLVDLKELKNVSLKDNLVESVLKLGEHENLEVFSLARNPLGTPGSVKKFYDNCPVNESVNPAVRSFCEDSREWTMMDFCTFNDASIKQTVRFLIEDLTDEEPKDEVEALMAQCEIVDRDVKSQIGAYHSGVSLVTEVQIASILPFRINPDLVEISIRDQKVTDLSPLIHFPKLKKINLESNRISDLTPLAKLEQITEVRLDYNEISDISPIRDLTKITEFILDNNPLGADIPKTSDNCPIDSASMVVADWCQDI